MLRKGKAAALTTALKNTIQTQEYHSVDDKSTDFQKQNAIDMAAMILLRLQSGYYTLSQQEGVWPTIEVLLRRHLDGGHNAA